MKKKRVEEGGEEEGENRGEEQVDRFLAAVSHLSTTELGEEGAKIKLAKLVSQLSCSEL